MLTKYILSFSLAAGSKDMGIISYIASKLMCEKMNAKVK